MAALKECAQSLWYPYVQKNFFQEEESEGSKSGVNCKNLRLKNGELILALARCLMMDCSVTLENLSVELGVTVRSIKTGLKKIRDKLDSGHMIPGLNEVETNNLAQALAKRDNSRKESKPEHIVDEKAKESKEKVITIIREFVIERMIKQGRSVAEIAEIVSLGKGRVRQGLEDLGYTVGVLAKEMMQSGNSVSDAAHHLSVSVKEIKQALSKVGYHIADTSLSYIDGGRKISMLKPGKPKNNKERKRPLKLSRTGLAEWCMQHYDKNGILRLPKGCRAPDDLPRRYPTPKMDLLPPAKPEPTRFPALPLSKAECTARGRNRIGYMRFF